jgi:hypothetical protein
MKMKRNRDVEALAERLTAGATAPLQVVSPAPEMLASAKPTGKAKEQKVSVFLRLPLDLHERIDALAVQRTKETGRGVSIQQVIIELLEQSL